jgi:uncharacterized membrane protein
MDYCGGSSKGETVAQEKEGTEGGTMKMKFVRTKSTWRNRPSVIVHRTKEGLVFEVISAVLIVLLWVIAVVLFLHSPEKVPTHFGANLEANAIGSKSVLLIMAVVGTFTTILMLVSAYFPHKMVNMPFEVTDVRQYAPIVQMTRVLAIEIALLFISIVTMMGDSKSVLPKILLICVFVLIIITTIYYSVKAYKLRKTER